MLSISTCGRYYQRTGFPSERYGICAKGLRSYFIVEFSYCRQAKNLPTTEPGILPGVKVNGH